MQKFFLCDLCALCGGKKKGLTLIELVVALALSSLLLVTTAGVIKSMHEKKKVFADQLDVQPWRVELAERLRDDLLRSKEMRIGPRSLELLGFSGHDPVTGEPNLVPVQVRWTLKKEGAYEILTRTETPHGGLEDFLARPRTELIAVGVVNFSIGSFTGLENEQRSERRTITASGRLMDGPGEWVTMPKALTLVVHGPKNTVLVNELIYR